jgi:CRISPR/Cas system-associated exonuclease Cas4 (RecB family)
LNAIVVDYKTGKPLTKHTLQIKEYGNLLEEMGYKHIEKYLLYINNLKIVTV